MKPDQNVSPESVPASVEAEAAAWIAKLHNTDRTPEDERSFQRWLAESALHKTAFEGMTDAWEAAGQLQSDVLLRQRLAPSRPIQGNAWVRGGGSPRKKMLVLATAAMLAAIGLFLSLQGSISTSVGERRDITLTDGSRVTLNTDTRIKVRYDERQRLVKLERGEAFFDVAKRKERPFIVVTADSHITALGTSFSVRSERGMTEVTLVEGAVAVSAEPSAQAPRATRSSRVVLSPGERLTLVPKSAPRIDRPKVDKIVAWRRGLISLEKTSLADAVAEMNRYSETKLVVVPEIADAIKVSGVFYAGDSEEFARGLADSHGLRVSHENGSIVLSGP